MKKIKTLLISSISSILISLSLGCGNVGNNTYQLPTFKLYPQTTTTSTFTSYNVNNKCEICEDIATQQDISNQQAPVYPKDKNEFLKLLSQQNINLNQTEINQVTQFTIVEPSGLWTPGPMNDREANKKAHFEKHGAEFNCTSVEDYYNRAVKFNKRHEFGLSYFDCYHYKPNNVSVIKWDSKTKEFSAMRINGDIATYFKNLNLKFPRFIQVPKDMYGNIGRK